MAANLTHADQSPSRERQCPLKVILVSDLFDAHVGVINWASNMPLLLL
jgi:hypothetical protein